LNSTKTIFLIRHGETDYNRKGIVQGSGIDAELNELGHNQAAAFYEHYKGIPFQKVYTSELVRTHQSVKAFIESGINHEILAGLNEISWGVKEGKVPTKSERSFYQDIMSRWAQGDTFVKIEGGESPEDVVIRQKIALNRILEPRDENTILIAMHGRAMRILLTQLCNVPLTEMDTFEHCNLCLYKLIYSYETDSFELLDRNNTIHLEKTSDM
jgi:broad specificity phosphatase PhoE